MNIYSKDKYLRDMARNLENVVAFPVFRHVWII